MTNQSRNHLQKKRDREEAADPILQSLLQQGKTMIQHLAEAAGDRQLSINNQKEALATQKLTLKANKKKIKFNARLEVAKALNDVEELKKLMEEARAMDSDEEEDK
jgi:hypothetical protein